MAGYDGTVNGTFFETAFERLKSIRVRRMVTSSRLWLPVLEVPR